MTYEKAELILQQLMAGDRSMYLISKEGKSMITDRPKKNDRIIGEIKKKKKGWRRILHSLLAIVFVFVTPTANDKSPEPRKKGVISAQC